MAQRPRGQTRSSVCSVPASAIGPGNTPAAASLATCDSTTATMTAGSTQVRWCACVRGVVELRVVLPVGADPRAGSMRLPWFF